MWKPRIEKGNGILLLLSHYLLAGIGSESGKTYYYDKKINWRPPEIPIATRDARSPCYRRVPSPYRSKTQIREFLEVYTVALPQSRSSGCIYSTLQARCYGMTPSLNWTVKTASCPGSQKLLPLSILEVPPSFHHVYIRASSTTIPGAQSIEPTVWLRTHCSNPWGILTHEEQVDLQSRRVTEQLVSLPCTLPKRLPGDTAGPQTPDYSPHSLLAHHAQMFQALKLAQAF